MAKPLVVCNGRRPSFFLLASQLTTGPLLCVYAAGTLCAPPLQADALVSPLIVWGSGTMKSTIDLSTLGRIILSVGALGFLPSVEAVFATCKAGWEWVRSYLFLAAFKSNPFAFSVIQFQRFQSL